MVDTAVERSTTELTLLAPYCWGFIDRQAPDLGGLGTANLKGDHSVLPTFRLILVLT